MASRALRVAAVIAAAAAALAGACVGYDACDARVTRSASATAWADYTACLVGDPVPPGQHLTERLRAIDLGQVLDAAATGDWPARCRPHVVTLAQLLASTARHDPRAQPASDAAAKLGSPLDLGGIAPDLVDALSDALVPLAWLAVTAAPAHDPPPPRPVLVDIARAALAPLPGGDADDLPRTDHVASRALRLAWGKTRPHACRFDPGLLRATCPALRDPPPGLSDPVPAPEDDDSRTTVLGLYDGSSTPHLYRAEDWARLAADPLLPSFVRADGSILEVAPRHLDSILRRGADEIGIAIPGDASVSALASDAVVWIENDRLESRVIGADSSLGPIVDLGPVPAGDHVLRLCRSRRTLVVRVVTDGGGSTLVFRTDGAWSAPVHSPGAGGPPELTCEDERATLTWMDRDGIHRVDCDPHQCSRVDAKLPGDVSAPGAAVASLGDRVLLVSTREFSSRIPWTLGRAVVTRLAPLTELASAPERVLVAGAAHGGLDVATVQSFARDGVALVVLGGERAYWPLRVGPEGDVKPVAVSP